MQVVTSLLGIGLAFGVYNFFSQESQMGLIKASFKQKIEFNPPDCFIGDTTLIRHMKDKLKFQDTTGVYYLLEGPHKSGISTALRYAAEAVGDNIVYVTLEQSIDFGLSLANALSIDLGCREYPSAIDPLLEKVYVKNECPKGQEDKVRSCLYELETALKQIQKEGSPAPILIIDHVDSLLDKNTTIVLMLQAFAKRMADERLLTIYFVSSEAKTYTFLLQRSAASRMVVLPHREWELSDKNAFEYLHCLCKNAGNSTITDIGEESLCKFADNNTIIEIIKVVGGGFTHILRAGNIFQQLNDTDVNIMDIKNKLFETVISDLQTLNISLAPPTDQLSQDLSGVTWSLAKKIVITTKISLEEVENMLEELSQDEKDALTEESILYFDWFNREVTFRSTLVHSYFKNAFEEVQTSRDEADQE